MEIEQVQRRGLRRKQAIASGLLLVMAAIFLTTLAIPSRDFWILLIQATAEAALIGGLADWFAVTALFRRPLGLPIPHTAIVPTNKDRIGEGLAAFLERNFLSREIAMSIVWSEDPVSKLALWLAVHENADSLAGQILRLLPHLAEVIDDQEIGVFASEIIQDQAREIDVRPLVNRLMRELAAMGFHAALMDDALRGGRDFLDRKKGRFEELVAKRHRGWIRKMVNRQVARTIIEGVQALIDDLLNPDSGARRSLLQSVENRAAVAAVEAGQKRSVELVMVRLIEDPEIRAWVTSAWDRFRSAALARIDSPNSKARQALTASISSAGKTLLNNPTLRDKFNVELRALIVEVLPWREKVLDYVTATVRKWDAQAFSERVELTVGADLQYIRINGTAVGALIGCLLYLGKAALQ